MKEGFEPPASVRVIKNPMKPIFGGLTLELAEDLSIGRSNAKNYEFDRPFQIEVDGNGNIFVLDRGAGHIKKFDPTGIYLQTIGREGMGYGEFPQPPVSIAMDSKDRLYVSDRKNVYVFDKQGGFLKMIAFDKAPWQRFGITQEGNFIFATGFINLRDNGPEVLGLYGPDGRKLKTIATFSLPQDAPGAKEYPRRRLPPSHLYFCPLSEDRIVYGNSYEYKLCVMNSVGDFLFVIEKEELLELKPFFDGIGKDDLGNIYIRRLNTGGPNSGRISLVHDLFNKDGLYLYRIDFPFALNLIKSGYAYGFDRGSGSGVIVLRRYTIKNWDALKRAVTSVSN